MFQPIRSCLDIKLRDVYEPKDEGQLCMRYDAKVTTFSNEERTKVASSIWSSQWKVVAVADIDNARGTAMSLVWDFNTLLKFRLKKDTIAPGEY